MEQNKKPISSIIFNENNIIESINKKIDDVYNAIDKSDGLVSESYITDFESFSLNVYFSNNTKSALIEVEDDKIIININNKEIEISPDGEVDVS